MDKRYQLVHNEISSLLLLCFSRTRLNSWKVANKKSAPRFILI